jgi:hypothetical protein
MNASAQVNVSDGIKTDGHWPWTNILFCTFFCLFIITVIVGNTLVILSVITTRRLRTVTNCFVMSLAVADWLVGIFVMPPAVFVFLVGECVAWCSIAGIIDVHPPYLLQARGRCRGFFVIYGLASMSCCARPAF